ncbi:MAG: hypothetical protein LBG43_01465 [Treponema sp.]|jgi:hypothetical protein|nr:hypothetical protein [Treponema sp.]
MKKFFVVLLTLALVAGGAFAEVSWGGYALSAVTIAGGSTAENSDIIAGNGPSGSGAWGLYGLGRIQARVTNDEGTFGAFVRTGVNTGSDGNWGYRGFAWWQPISHVRLQIGFFDNMAVNYVVGWGFHASGADDTVAFDGYGRRGRSFWSYNGEHTGALLSIAPIEGLSIKIGVPYAAHSGPKAAEIYNHTIGQITYDIANIGQIAVTYQSGAGYRAWPTVKEDPGVVYAQFYLTAVDKLQLNVGLSYGLAGEYESSPKTTVAVSPPIKAGFGVAYAVSDAIGVKARFGASFVGSRKVGSVETKDPVLLGFDVMPYFDVGVCKVLVNMGIAVDLPDPGDSVFNWYLNPYITKSAGGATFYAGLQVFSAQESGKDIIKWGIPIGIDYGF